MSASEARAQGVSPQTIANRLRQGKLKQIARGLYVAPEFLPGEWYDFQVLALRCPDAVVCLYSALRIHNLTTQLPGDISFALPQGRRVPALHDFKTRVFFMSQAYYAYGIEERSLDGVRVKVYSPAKTVADCFKYRNKVGIDVAIESLRECLSRKAATIDEIVRAARTVRAEKVILPYLEGITA
jgi:predicted transcriptional regulator of viral defense system